MHRLSFIAGADSDEELSVHGNVVESRSFDILSESSQSEHRKQCSTSGPVVSSFLSENNETGVSQSHAEKFTQRISKEDIEELVHAITEIQSSVSQSESLLTLAGHSGKCFRLRKLQVYNVTKHHEALLFYKEEISFIKDECSQKIENNRYA